MTAETPPGPPADSAAPHLTPIERVAIRLDAESSARKWLRAWRPYLDLKPRKGENPHVEAALDTMIGAIARRVTRIAQSDLVAPDDDEA
jgi:hypothetical protein